ncbi:hypothetical protein [Shimia thalassica]|uniref:hypothetical protein n=1 Tax=Shimia thalassica TaxID=1715693 RepID=UPI00249400C8|nr:hypothetical protein [Shimia thalassica]
MTDSYTEFQARVARIYDGEKSKRSFFKKRTSQTLDRDGYFVIRGAARRRSFPWTGLLLVAVAFFGTKGAVMAKVGPDFYSQQVDRLAPASVIEEAGAWTMRPDPISRWVAMQIKSLG